MKNIKYNISRTHIHLMLQKMHITDLKNTTLKIRMRINKMAFFSGIPNKEQRINYE